MNASSTNPSPAVSHDDVRAPHVAHHRLRQGRRRAARLGIRLRVWCARPLLRQRLRLGASSTTTRRWPRSSSRSCASISLCSTASPVTSPRLFAPTSRPPTSSTLLVRPLPSPATPSFFFFFFLFFDAQQRRLVVEKVGLVAGRRWSASSQSWRPSFPVPTSRA